LLLAGCATDAPAPKPVAAIAPSALDTSDPALTGLDAADRQIAATAERQALEAGGSGKPVEWRSSTNAGRFGSAVAGPVVVQNGLNCRPVTQTVYIDGVPQTGRSTLCRQPDGAWRRSG
jgi:surface antigen